MNIVADCHKLNRAKFSCVLARNLFGAIVFVVICDIGIAGKSYGQTLQFRHYSTDEGFFGGAFKRIAQDSLGFLWISSATGVYKFDGYDFTEYRPQTGDTLSIPQELVDRIWVDPRGRIWTGFPDRVAVYDRELDGFRSYKFSPATSRVPDAIFFENGDVVWLSIPEKGLIRLDIVNRSSSNHLNTSGDKGRFLKTNTVRDIKSIGEDLLLATSNGLWMFDRNTNTFNRPICDPSDSALFYNSDVQKIISRPDHYWIWLDHQLVKCDRRFIVIQSLDLNIIKQRFDLANGFDGPVVQSIQQDKRGQFWIATQGLGLVVFDPVKNQLSNFRNDRNDPESLPSDVLNDIMIDNNNNVWLASLPKGIIQVKQRSLQFINHLPGTSVGKMVLLKTDGLEQLVFCTQGDGLWSVMIDPRTLDKLKFQNVVLTSRQRGFKSLTGVYHVKDHVWVSSLTSGIMGIPVNKKIGIDKNAPLTFYEHDPGNPNTISSNRAHNIVCETNDGTLLAPSLYDGFSIISPNIKYGTRGSVTRYQHNESDTTSLCNNGVIDIKIEPDNSFLLASQGGLDIFKDGKFRHYLKNIPCTRLFEASDGTLLIASKVGLFEGQKKGRDYTFTKAQLPGEPFITSVCEDRLGRVWCMSYEGLYFYDRRTKQYLLFKKEDGLPSSRPISGCGSAYTSDGTMIFGNAEGITFFDPLSLRINEASPKPVLTKLKINNKIISSTAKDKTKNDFFIGGNINTLGELTVGHTQNIISLEFSAMDLTAPERNKYSYQLAGFDPEPIITDAKNRSATYTNLRSGDYTFIVKATNRDGVWSDNQSKLVIHVLPPPWKTRWAYTLYGLVVATILFLARRNIIHQERLASRLAMEHIELEKAQEIDKVKTNFFANISHEFRTPLTLIQGPVQLLLEKFRKDREVEGQLTLIQQNADRLLRLVNQILELARLESGGLKIETSQSDVIVFLRRIVGSFSSLAIQKRISFVQQFPDHGLLASFDRDKLEKITTNLISNAIKFTPENGAVIVNTSVATKSEGEAILTFRVTDTGKGIPEDKLDKIFERFYQVKEDGNVNVGSGIGLALCKELAEFLGGSLTLESKVGEGSRFAMNIPLSDVEQISGLEVESSQEDITVEEIKVELPSNGNTEKPLLLIVEDHSELRKFIIACLGTNYQFVEASNGREGLSFAIDQVPTLILSDVMMPEMDGMEMCRKIKDDPRTSHIPVILITARASDESRLTGLETGADDYIVKPFNKDELILKIRNQVTARARMQERIRLEFLSQGSVVKAVSADEKFLEKLKKIVESRLNDEMLSVESLTEEIGMSRAQLYRKVTALTGISGNEFIRKLRLQKAAQLLQQQTGPVSQVAYEVGFSNLSYFSKCFKEEFGVLPSEYGFHASVRR